MTVEEVLWSIAMLIVAVAFTMYARALINLVSANNKLRRRKLQAATVARRLSQVARTAEEAGFAEMDKDGSTK